MVMRFIIGQTSDQAQEADLEAEASQYGGFMRLHLQVPFAAPVFSRPLCAVHAGAVLRSAAMLHRINLLLPLYLPGTASLAGLPQRAWSY